MISGNIVDYNKLMEIDEGNGIVFFKSENNFIVDNSINHNKYGIWVRESSNKNVISKNAITNNEDYGVYLSDKSNKNSILDNKFTANGVCIEENDCFGNIYLNNGLCIYIGAPYLTYTVYIIIFSLIGIIIPSCILGEIKRRKMRKYRNF